MSGCLRSGLCGSPRALGLARRSGPSGLLARLSWTVVALALVWCPSTVQAQFNQLFDAQLEAVKLMIVQGVQQGISSLPPTSGQAFTYEFDPKLDTYVTNEQLGPTALRSPLTIGANKFSVRVATSYFELADTKEPIPYLVSSPPGTPLGIAKLGLLANARVGLMNLAATYGLGDRVEITANLPITVVDAHASSIFSTRTDALNVPPPQAPLSGVAVQNGDVAGAVTDLNSALQPGGPLSLRTESYNAIGRDFNQGTHTGIGRISVGVKGVLYADKVAQIAFAPEFFCPSPSEGEFAGSNSPAILPRVIGAFRVTDLVRLHADAGYDYDFDHNELRRFVWNGGPSFAIKGATFDFGVGGSTFNEGIKWTPTLVPGSFGSTPATFQALSSNRLGRNFVDGLGGVKVRVADKTVLSGSVNVPLNNDGFRAAAVGTLAVEQYF